MNIKNSWIPITLSMAASAAHWGLSSLVVEGEAWDGPLYFQLLPLLAVACAVIGGFATERPWRWGAIAAATQIGGLCLQMQGVGPLFAVGLAILALLALGLGTCSSIGASLSKRIYIQG